MNTRMYVYIYTPVGVDVLTVERNSTGKLSALAFEKNG